MNLLWLALFVVVLAVAVYLFSSRRVMVARRSGLLPEAGKATMADVERLVRENERILAIRCYREIHRCSLKDAKRAVNNLTSTS